MTVRHSSAVPATGIEDMAIAPQGGPPPLESIDPRRLRALRRKSGLSGHPSRAESEHDWVENSHASTSLAYAAALARAARLPRAASDRRMVSVVGDGALTGGATW